jgi:multiple sugar transport system substrate-binding protein
MMSDSKKSISRRDFLRLAGMATAATGVAAAGNLLAACAPASPSIPPTSSGTVKLVYQDWRTDWFPGLAEEMLAIFHEQHPNIRVFYTPDPEQLEEDMLEEFEAGTAPDVFAGCCSFFPAWGQKGYTFDLRPYVEADLDPETIADWSEAQYKAFFTQDGRQFALPKYHGGLALFYNKDLLDEANLPYPETAWTYEEYLDAMKKLTVRTDGKTTRWGSMFDVSWDRIQIHVNGWGGHFVNPQDPTQCEMASQPSLDALEWLRARIWDDKVMATSLDVEKLETRHAFIEQKIAMVEDGSWALKDILARAEFRVGVAPFPVGPVQHATLATTDGFAIFSGTKHPAEAWELMKFLISQEYGRAMARAHFLQPARASIIPDWVKYIQEEFPEKATEVDLAAFADGHVKGYSVTTEIFPNMLEVTNLARDTWDRIYTLGQAPVSEMAQLCEQIETLQGAVSSAPVNCDCES